MHVTASPTINNTTDVGADQYHPPLPPPPPSLPPPPPPIPTLPAPSPCLLLPHPSVSCFSLSFGRTPLVTPWSSCVGGLALVCTGTDSHAVLLVACFHVQAAGWFVFLVCLASQPHASVSQICSDNCALQITDTGPTSPSTDPLTPDRVAHGSANFSSRRYNSTRKIPPGKKAGIKPGYAALEADALTTRPRRR